jgi:hypothetical protein
MKKLLTIYFIVCGLLIGLSVPFGFIYVLNTYNLTPRQFFLKSADKLSITSPLILSLIEPETRYANHPFDGTVKAGHPRILNLPLAGWTKTAAPPALLEKVRYLTDHKIPFANPCGGGQLTALAACWIVQGDKAAAQKGIEGLRTARHVTPDAQALYGNGWELALVYDLLATYPEFPEDARATIQHELRLTLVDYLRLLDDPSPSLWHGRASLAANAWLCAVALDNPGEEDLKLMVRAQGHFLDVMSALGVTEAWPEGYNYWIQNRGFILALAASAYVHGLEGSQLRNDVAGIVERAGLWPLYAMRPDNRVENLGDEGSRVDLKEETRRVIDLFAQTTRSPTLGTFSSYLGRLHKLSSYYGQYRWGFLLFNEPALAAAEGAGQVGELPYFDRALPKSQVFGRNALNLVYIRSGWSPDATFISYRAGHSFTHHGHYDAGHFTLFKGAPLAVNSSRYGSGMFSPNRLNYSIRTVAKNSLLILRPDEKVKPNRFFETNVADGGQRILLPTGSAIRSLEDWRDNLYAGSHYEGGELSGYEHVDGVYTYVGSDLTGAYNSSRHDDNDRGGKVGSVRRELLYLYPEDRLIVRDGIRTTDPDFQVKWLLHTANQPEAEGLRAVKGTDVDGILAGPARSVRVANPPGFLRLDWLQPQGGELRLVGGPTHKHYVESDGDETRLDGENFSEGAREAPWFDRSDWRIELNAPRGRTAHAYLVVLTPSLNQPRQEAPPAVQSVPGATVVTLPESVVVFVTKGETPRTTLTLGDTAKHLYIVGEPAPREVVIDGATFRSETDGASVFHLAFGGEFRGRTRSVSFGE